MTALAMILGMLPMAMALGEGGEQNAPLGRAVIGGLLVATFGTLFVVPIIYSLLRTNRPIDYDERIDNEYRGKSLDYTCAIQLVALSILYAEHELTNDEYEPPATAG